MKTKTTHVITVLSAVGLGLAASGWLAFGPRSSKAETPPVFSAAPSASIPSYEASSPRVMTTGSLAGKRYALLVGIGTYQYSDDKHLANLAGPPSDVRSMAQVLRTRWGFDSITILLDAEATRANILKQLDDLARVVEPGSHILFYYSGHGTSRQDSKTGLPLPHTSGALLAYDSNPRLSAKPEIILDSLIIGSRDLRPRFEAMDRKGVYVTAWLDACFSENSSYSLAASTGSRRYTPLPPLDVGEFGSDSVAYQPYPYRNAVTFAASAANQTARDINQGEIQRYPTFDGAYHGAFSDALLRALTDRALPGYGSLDKNGDNVVTVEELATGVASFMRERGYDHTPKLQPIQVEDTGGGRNRALFQANGQVQPSASAATAAPVRPAALRVTFVGSLDIRRQLANAPALEWVDSNAELTVTAQASDYELRDPAGAIIGTVKDLSTLKEALRRRALLNQLVVTIRQAGRSTVGLDLASAYATTRLPLGDSQHPVRVLLTFKADQVGYPVVLDLFGDGIVRRFYPLAGNQEYTMRWTANQPKPLLCFQTEPPIGVDTLYAFILDRPLPVDVVGNGAQINPNDGGSFDALLDQLSQPGRALGADRLNLEIYAPQANELQAWREKGC